MAGGGIARLAVYDGPAVLRFGFRPFFLGAGIWAAAAMVLWVLMVRGVVTLPTGFDPVAWHFHELLFGSVAATMVGFVLTAIPNWTGRLPLQGLPLGLLAGLWLAGRLAVAFSAMIGPVAAAVIDLGFLAVVFGAVAREIVAGKNWRNLPMVAGLGILLAADLLTHLEPLGVAATGAVGARLGIAAVIALISLIGGRIIPSFTRNWLKKRRAQRLPNPFGPVDRGALFLSLAALVLWIVAPMTVATATLAGAAAAANAVRLARWRGVAVRREPLLWSLHIGYLWLPAGFGLMCLAALGPVPASAAVHALTVGAMGTMTLAVMTRATLGHTGRPLTADGATTAMYVLVGAAALARLAAVLFPAAFGPLVDTAGLLWFLAFALFVLVYGPKLVTPGRNVRT